MNLTRKLVLMLLIAGAALAFLPGGTADAAVFGECEIIVNGQNIQGDPAIVVVQPGADVSYQVTTASPIREYYVKIVFGEWHSEPIQGAVASDKMSASGSVPIDDYAFLGAGKYEIVGTATFEEGQGCMAQMILDVQGNPLTTVGGLGAVGLAMMGTLGTLTSSMGGLSNLLGTLKGFLGK